MLLCRRHLMVCAASTLLAATAAPAWAAPMTDDTTIHIDRDLITAVVSGMPKAGFVGVTTAFARPGEPLFAVTAGATARAHDATPLKAQHRMRIASLTKPMVATAVMRLVERGVWTLDTPANVVKPGVLPGHDDVTLRMLLSHTSGLMDGVNVLMAQYFATHESQGLADLVTFFEKPYTLQDGINAALSVPGYPAGEVARYSNTNYAVLGLLLEHVTGFSLPEVLQHEVFGPAGMTSATVVENDGPHDTAQYFALSAETEEWFNLSKQHNGVYGGSGAVDATPSDVVTFWKALANGTLVSKATFALMRTPSPQSLNPTGLPEKPPVWERPVPGPYGLGVMVIAMPTGYRCEKADGTPVDHLYGHGGSMFATVSDSLVDADGDTAMAASFNSLVLQGSEKPSTFFQNWGRARGQLKLVELGWFCHKLTLPGGSARVNPPLPQLDAFPFQPQRR